MCFMATRGILIGAEFKRLSFKYGFLKKKKITALNLNCKCASKCFFFFSENNMLARLVLISVP